MTSVPGANLLSLGGQGKGRAVGLIRGMAITGPEPGNFLKNEELLKKDLTKSLVRSIFAVVGCFNQQIILPNIRSPNTPCGC